MHFFVSCISCSAANTASKVPILMYHNLTNDPSAVTSMTITGERFQEDMEYLEYNGYTPLLSSDLIDIRAGKEAMPERPVMITLMTVSLQLRYCVPDSAENRHEGRHCADRQKHPRKRQHGSESHFSSSGTRQPKWPTVVW